MYIYVIGQVLLCRLLGVERRSLYVSWHDINNSDDKNDLLIVLC